MQDFYGDVFYLIKKAEEYILEQINIGMRLESLLRVDVPEIDREAIINAFCHGHYRECDSVNIAIFKDRVEIRSPGLLYANLTVADIRRKMLSERRNERLAELLHQVHFIEKCGRGIKMILEREPQTEFEELGTHFIATFRRNSYELPKPGGVGETTQKNSVKSSVKIIEAIRENNTITAVELSQHLGLTLRAVEKLLAKMKLEGVLRCVGPDKGGY